MEVDTDLAFAWPRVERENKQDATEDDCSPFSNIFIILFLTTSLDITKSQSCFFASSCYNTKSETSSIWNTKAIFVRAEQDIAIFNHIKYFTEAVAAVAANFFCHGAIPFEPPLY